MSMTCSTYSCAPASSATSHRYFMKASPVRPGDFIEFFAEIDLIGALSARPGGDCGETYSERRGPLPSAEGRRFSARATRRCGRPLEVSADGDE